MNADGMRKFWDRRADENALFYVDSRLDYSSPDEERFWQQGERDLIHLLGLIGKDVRDDDDVVEIGCGVGRLTRGLSHRARTVQAIDVSARMLAHAARYNAGHEGIEWIHGDGHSLSGVDDASATVCFSHVVFQHIPDPDVTLAYVREMGRVLKPGGWAGFQVSDDPKVHRRQSLVRRAAAVPVRLAGKAPRGQDDRFWRGSAIDLAELEAEARGVGLVLGTTHGRGTQWCVVRLDRV